LVKKIQFAASKAPDALKFILDVSANLGEFVPLLEELNLGSDSSVETDLESEELILVNGRLAETSEQ
jgi:hypothetical protein